MLSILSNSRPRPNLYSTTKLKETGFVENLSKSAPRGKK